MAQMNDRQLGSGGLVVSALGFGCMGLSHGYGNPVDERFGFAECDSNKGTDSRPERIRTAVEGSLQRLGTDRIPHLVESLGGTGVRFAAAELVELTTSASATRIRGERLPPAVPVFSDVEAPPRPEL